MKTDFLLRHLTDVESRVQRLEAALERLFPSGDVDSILRLVLDGELSQREEPTLSSQGILPLGDDSLLSFSSAEPSSDDNLTIEPVLGTQNKSEGSFLGMLEQSETPASRISGENEHFLIDCYFRHYQTIYPFVHEATFRAEQENPMIRSDPGAWLILQDMALAFGAWLDPSGPQEVSAKYYDRARSQMQRLPVFTRPGSLTMVQTLLLLSDFAQRQGHLEEGRQYLGAAMQMATILQLHREPARGFPARPSLKQEIQRRVWWSLYCFESCSAKIHGRPLLLPEDSLITAKLPSNVDDSSSMHAFQSLPAEVDVPTIYSSLIEQSSYHRMANRLYRTLLDNATITAQDVHKLTCQIDEWHTTSPDYLQYTHLNPVPDWLAASRNRQLLCDRSLRLLIQRPLLLRWLRMKSHTTSNSAEASSAERQCRLEGLQLACTTVEIVADLIMRREYTVLTLPFILYSLFHALLVPAIHLKAEPSSLESISCRQDFLTVQRLLSLIPATKDALASSFITVLGRLCSFATRAEPSTRVNHSSPEASSPSGVHPPSTNIFGNEEMDILESTVSGSSLGVDFSNWLQ